MYYHGGFSLLEVESDSFQSICLFPPLSDVTSKFVTNPVFDDALNCHLVSVHSHSAMPYQIEC
jgi:hypothetical protein